MQIISNPFWVSLAAPKFQGGRVNSIHRPYFEEGL
jgi:hypothetical protein